MPKRKPATSILNQSFAAGLACSKILERLHILSRVQILRALHDQALLDLEVAKQVAASDKLVWQEPAARAQQPWPETAVDAPVEPVPVEGYDAQPAASEDDAR